MSRTERFNFVERGDLTTNLPWLMEYTEGTPTRLRGPAREATDAVKFERAASACRHQGEITVAARSLVAEPRAPGNEATWTTVKAKFPEEDRNSVQAAAAAARAASVTEPEEGSGPTWRPEGQFNQTRLRSPSMDGMQGYYRSCRYSSRTPFVFCVQEGLPFTRT